MSENPYQTPPEAIDDAAIQAARAKCKELARLKVQEYQARSSLYATGFDKQTVEMILPEYPGLLAAERRGERRRMQIVGLLVFLGSGGLFVYFAAFSPNMRVLVWPLLAGAMWGLFKLLLP